MLASWSDTDRPLYFCEGKALEFHVVTYLHSARRRLEVAFTIWKWFGGCGGGGGGGGSCALVGKLIKMQKWNIRNNSKKTVCMMLPPLVPAVKFHCDWSFWHGFGCNTACDWCPGFLIFVYVCGFFNLFYLLAIFFLSACVSCACSLPAWTSAWTPPCPPWRTTR